MRRLVLVVLLALAAAGCARAPRSRCERVCKREAECAEQTSTPEVDVVACVDACAALERDAKGVRLVNRHVLCVDNAPSCATLIDCP